MRLAFIIIISFWTLSLSGQVDSILNVQYIKTIENDRQQVVYINGEVVNSSILKTIDPNLIAAIQVEKKEVELNGKSYYGQIFMKMKNEYKPNIISLTDLKLKYIKASNKPVIFMINNDIVKGDYNNYLVDQNFILKIVVDNFENEKLDIDIVQLLTKTEKNIENSKKIIIRGFEEKIKI